MVCFSYFFEVGFSICKKKFICVGFSICKEICFICFNESPLEIRNDEKCFLS